MVEGFWKRLGREAARTQGADLPPFKDFKTSFRHMRASCGGVEVTPIHPFVLEHRVTEKNVIREGLYVFDPDAFGPAVRDGDAVPLFRGAAGTSRYAHAHSYDHRPDLE